MSPRRSAAAASPTVRPVRSIEAPERGAGAADGHDVAAARSALPSGDTLSKKGHGDPRLRARGCGTMMVTARTRAQESTMPSSPRLFVRARRTVLIAGATLGIAAMLRPRLLLAQTASGKLRIGTIGAGRIGGTVGGLWVKAGHPVMFSSKNPEEGKELAARLGPL